MTGTEIEPRQTAAPVNVPPQIIEVKAKPVANAETKRAWITQGLEVLSDVVRLALQLWPEKPAETLARSSSPQTNIPAATFAGNATGTQGRGRKRRLRQRGRRSR